MFLRNQGWEINYDEDDDDDVILVEIKTFIADTNLECWTIHKCFTKRNYKRRIIRLNEGKSIYILSSSFGKW